MCGSMFARRRGGGNAAAPVRAARSGDTQVLRVDRPERRRRARRAWRTGPRSPSDDRCRRRVGRAASPRFASRIGPAPFTRRPWFSSDCTAATTRQSGAPEPGTTLFRKVSGRPAGRGGVASQRGAPHEYKSGYYLALSPAHVPRQGRIERLLRVRDGEVATTEIRRHEHRHDRHRRHDAERLRSVAQTEPAGYAVGNTQPSRTSRTTRRPGSSVISGGAMAPTVVDRSFSSARVTACAGPV